MKEPTQSLPNSKFWRFQQFSLVVSQDGSVHMADHPLSSPSFPGNTKVVCTCSGSCNAVDANCVEKARQTKKTGVLYDPYDPLYVFFKGVSWIPVRFGLISFQNGFDFCNSVCKSRHPKSAQPVIVFTTNRDSGWV